MSEKMDAMIISENPVEAETGQETTKKRTTTDFVAQEDWSLISQGAEARIWKIPAGSSSSFQVDAIAKERFPKSYRHPILDERLTKQRCRAESRILTKCLEKGGLDVPAVLRVEPPVLYLGFVEGKTLRDTLEELLDQSSDVLELAKSMGDTVGKIHSLGIVHGDLTTSNIMMRRPSIEKKHHEASTSDSARTETTATTPESSSSRSIVLIDFGLAKNTTSAEERAVDLYVLERALLSTHPRLPENFWDTVILSYKTLANKADATLTRLEQVRQRGRKRECFG
jgi:TP53 regulating kinase-like protein